MSSSSQGLDERPAASEDLGPSGAAIEALSMIRDLDWFCSVMSTAESCTWPECGCDPYANHVLASMPSAPTQEAAQVEDKQSGMNSKPIAEQG